MATWTEDEAKAQFSEVLDKAESEGPQLVNRRKQEFLVMTKAQHTAQIQQSAEEMPFVSAWDALRPSSGELFAYDFPSLRSKARAPKF
jgi:prevent-host-death family protein